MNEDGSDLKKLLDSEEHGYQHFGYPDWSPDGTQIVFSALKPPWEILIANADGSGLHTIDGTTGGMYPDWSPDGKKIAFSVWNGSSDIYTINIVGTDLQKIITSDANEIDPGWSPDGSQIVFYAYRKGEDSELYIIGSDGNNVTQLTDNEKDEWAPSWSPSGNQIAYLFGRGEEEYCEVRVLNINISLESRYTDQWVYPDLSAYPGVCWAPDGQDIAFVSKGRIYTTPFLGEMVFNEIFSGPDFTGYPSWK